MMLQALIEYAQRNQLGSDAYLGQTELRWAIALNSNGLSTVVPLSEPGSNPKKPAPLKVYAPFTSANELNQGDKSHFLCDTLERATVFFDGKTPEKEEGRRVQHAYFKKLLQEAADACPTEAGRLNSVLSFLNNPDALSRLHDELRSRKAKPNDKATFWVEGNSLLKEELLAPLLNFWRIRQQKKAGPASATREAGKDQRMCIATGVLGETLNTTEKIKGVPGGLAVGTNLISFDKDAFCSYGLEQAQNAALSATAELQIRSALNSLIEKSREQKLVFNDVIYLHWTREPVKIESTDMLLGTDENAIDELLKSIHKGDQYYIGSANAYYAMSLSGNGARIVVRDWLESTVPEIDANIGRWFEHLSIIHTDGSRPKRDFKFGALLYGMVRAELDELSPALPAQIFHSALVGGPLPMAALAAAVRRQQLDQENKLNPSRIALIKACLIRTGKEINLMTDQLKADSTDAAYNCGQLFAVFAQLQYLAQGEVNAGVIERFYASASVTPSLVMGRLFRNAQNHISKLSDGRSVNIEKEFESLSQKIGTSFPETLDLEGQGRFALGYYHQKAEFRRRSAEAKEKKQQTDEEMKAILQNITNL
ncbi:MAG: type I-C CRISPR-associated protein Cas8c/Csd1 [Candidatus Methylacidiphilales bacterium]|nr:type I-C CRISPR-associated protein Cas8c/Csd1 [Candidatus Methylacidiphilales bacterium]